MPTYEYVCLSCGRHFEVYQRFSDTSLEHCEVCGGDLRKVFHPAGILFKGSGFYVTDSRGKTTSAASSSDGAKDKEKAKEPASKDASKESSSKKDAAPAASSSGTSGSSGSKGSGSKETSA